MGSWARWISNGSSYPKPPIEEIWAASRQFDIEYERYAKDRVDVMVAPVRDEAIGLLTAIGKEPSNAVLYAFADWLKTEIGSTPVELHKYPPWMLNNHRKRQCEVLENHDWDHWGRTVLFGLEIFVTEPYRDQDWATDACQKKTPWDGVPFFSEAGWHSGCIRVGWFDRVQLSRELRPYWKALEGVSA